MEFGKEPTSDEITGDLVEKLRERCDIVAHALLREDPRGSFRRQLSENAEGGLKGWQDLIGIQWHGRKPASWDKRV